VTAGLAEPIPWTFTNSPGVLLWTWISEHFVARVSGAEVSAAEDPIGRRVVRSYQWDLSDLMRTQQGLPRLLIEGAAPSFEAAEAAIREHVGKCYDPRLGYVRFAGELAYTFTLSTGERIDISTYIGTTCTVTVLMPDGSSRSVTGDLEVEHYKWRLTTPEVLLEIIPEHVVRIANRSEAAERATALTHLVSYSGIGRMYREEPRPGCNGRPGFLVGTVDHAGAPRCPIHEAGVPEHLLR
jgi:hypothetical protein